MGKGKNHHPQAYGDEAYWDNRYTTDVGSFDWYQRYTGVSALMNKYVPKAGRILMAGCGNAVISEEMVKDGYENIVNIDISAVVIEAMQKKYKEVAQLSYIRLDVREMKVFKDASFDSIIDKGMFDSLMCGENAPSNAARMLEEVRRILRPAGVYMLITYGDPRVRMSHLKGPGMDWTVTLHVLPRPGSKRAAESSSRVVTDPVYLTEDGTLGPQFSFEDPDLHYVYVCVKETPVKGADKNSKSRTKK